MSLKSREELCGRHRQAVPSDIIIQHGCCAGKEISEEEGAISL